MSHITLENQAGGQAGLVYQGPLSLLDISALWLALRVCNGFTCSSEFRHDPKRPEMACGRKCGMRIQSHVEAVESQPGGTEARRRHTPKTANNEHGYEGNGFYLTYYVRYFHKTGPGTKPAFSC